MDVKLVAAQSRPRESDHKRGVELAEGSVGWDGESAPYGWVGDLVGVDLEFQEVVGMFAGGLVRGPVVGLAEFRAVRCGLSAGAIVQGNICVVTRAAVGWGSHYALCSGRVMVDEERKGWKFDPGFLYFVCQDHHHAHSRCQLVAEGSW